MKQQKLMIVTGPTAVGKTDFVIDLAQKLDTEIISADSVQIFKKLDIGSAKPSPEERSKAKHHLIDFLEPDAEYSVFDYRRDAMRIIADLHARGKLPIVSGGTGLYLHSLIYDMDFSGAEAREKSKGEYAGYSLEVLRDMLEERGIALSRDDWNNQRRLTRKLEIYESTGSAAAFTSAERKPGPFEVELIVLEREREELYERINRRVDEMMEQGLLGEVKGLLQAGLSKEHQSMRAIGYKELIEHLEGAYSLDEAVELIKRNSRRYAKRQLTWFRRYENKTVIRLPLPSASPAES